MVRSEALSRTRSFDVIASRLSHLPEIRSAATSFKSIK
jgi:hypothetical protein